MKNIEAIATQIVDSSIKVHRALGPGLLESAYQQCLAYELRKRDIHVLCEVLQPIYYDNQAIDAGYRIDMLVENQIIIENKCVEKIHPIHMAQNPDVSQIASNQIGISDQLEYQTHQRWH